MFTPLFCIDSITDRYAFCPESLPTPHVLVEAIAHYLPRFAAELCWKREIFGVLEELVSETIQGAAAVFVVLTLIEAVKSDSLEYMEEKRGDSTRGYIMPRFTRPLRSSIDESL